MDLNTNFTPALMSGAKEGIAQIFISVSLLPKHIFTFLTQSSRLRRTGAKAQRIVT
jgi:hypothetical protein